MTYVFTQCYLGVSNHIFLPGNISIRLAFFSSGKLQRYFKALMWYGIMNFKISNQAQLIQAALIAQILSTNEMIENEFGSVKMITDYFVGVADDIGPYKVLEAIESFVIVIKL